MKSLSKKNIKQLESIVSVLTATRDKLEADYAAYKAGIKANSPSGDSADTLLERLNESADRYAVAVDSANEFRQDIASVIEEYMGDRSDAWQESDKGEAYGAWKEAWEEEFESYLPDTKHNKPPTAEDWAEFNMDECPNVAELLEELPTEPDL